MTAVTPSGSSDPIGGVTTYRPGSAGYTRATTPMNTLVAQHPALVAVPADIDQVAACVRHAREHGLVVVPQATGHGASVELGPDVLLLDTSSLDQIQIDVESRTARVGSGCRWGDVNAQAFGHGLLGRSGSSPTVGVTGFTFGAGAGWLTRPWGLASGSLTAVDYVDGLGAVRRAADDAEDQRDRDVIWACRGGGGAGIAVSLEFGLVPVPNLWAGYRLWPIQALDAVADAWAGSIASVGPGLATSLAVLQAPPSPAVPGSLQGQWVVHLAMASSDGPDDARELEAGLAAAPAPALDTWGPSDAERLAQIHLDPPAPVPGLGRGRWLNDRLPELARAVYAAAVAGPLQMVEIRNVANAAPTLAGALDRVPGDYMLHAVGAPGPDGARAPLDAALDAIVAAAAPADTGLAIASWSDAQRSVPDGLPDDVRDRVAAIVSRVDPDQVLHRPTVVLGDTTSS